MAKIYARWAPSRLFSYQDIRGFTLVELLVVMAILGIALSLVGAFTVNQLDNMKRAQEREEIRLILNEWQFRAFNQRSAIALVFSGGNLAIKHIASPTRLQNQLDSQITQYRFEYSQFPSQVIEINAHGTLSNTDVQLMQGERMYVLTLINIGVTTDLLNEPDAAVSAGFKIGPSDAQ